jgi:hypothetical protein
MLHAAPRRCFPDIGSGGTAAALLICLGLNLLLLLD